MDEVGKNQYYKFNLSILISSQLTNFSYTIITAMHYEVNCEYCSVIIIIAWTLCKLGLMAKVQLKIRLPACHTYKGKSTDLIKTNWQTKQKCHKIT